MCVVVAETPPLKLLRRQAYPSKLKGFLAIGGLQLRLPRWRAVRSDWRIATYLGPTPVRIRQA